MFSGSVPGCSGGVWHTSLGANGAQLMSVVMMAEWRWLRCQRQLAPVPSGGYGFGWRCGWWVLVLGVSSSYLSSRGAVGQTRLGADGDQLTLSRRWWCSGHLRTWSRTMRVKQAVTGRYRSAQHDPSEGPERTVSSTLALMQLTVRRWGAGKARG